MPTAIVMSKGRVTLPQKIRKALRVRPGDRIDFVLTVGLEAMEDAISRRGSRPVTRLDTKVLVRCLTQVPRRGGR
jgi:AbrB family looped-hinge helix DNA binding protein